MTEALGRSFASLSIPNFRRYFTGQLISLSGNWMQMIAEMWWSSRSPAVAWPSA